MSSPALAYTVRDRSILLPFYKRVLVEPLLPWLPERLRPNAITHAGHVLALAALAVLVVYAPVRSSGWPFLAAAVLVNLYLWCDNADGSHARRTGQCSAMGEFLDHGLDLLNATYVGLMAVVALGAPPFWSVAAGVLVPAAAAVTYWEQAETGVFQLGMFNQIESVFALTMVLTLRASFGADALDAISVGPVSLRVLLLGVVAATAALGIVGSGVRVLRRRGRLSPLLAPVTFAAALLAAHATGALGALSAIVVGASVFVFVGVRSLTLRVHKRRPVFETGVLVAAAALGALAVLRARGAGPAVDWAVALTATIPFGLLALVHAHGGRRAVAELDAAKR